MSGKIYNHLVKNCSNFLEAFGIVRSVESGHNGVEAKEVKLHQKYSQRTTSRMMRVLMECMYPKEVKGSELVQAILQWEMKWNQMMKDQPGGTNIPELWRNGSLDEGVSEGDQAQRRAELGHDRREVLCDEGEGGHVGHKCSGKKEGLSSTTPAVLMDVGIVEGGGCEGRRMSRVRVGGCGATFVRITWPVNAPRRAKVREGRKVEERE